MQAPARTPSPPSRPSSSCTQRSASDLIDVEGDADARTDLPTPNTTNKSTDNSDTPNNSTNNKPNKESKEPSKEPKESNEPPPVVRGCYCGQARETHQRPPIVCVGCRSLFHQDCIPAIAAWRRRPLLGDDFYKFMCCRCDPDGSESFKRLHLSWTDAVHVALFNLELTRQPHKLSACSQRRYFHWKSQICDFIDANWDILWNKPRAGNWLNAVNNILSSVSSRFVCAADEFGESEQHAWALRKFELASAAEQPKRSRSVAFDIAPDGSLIVDEVKRERERERKRKRPDSAALSSASPAAATPRSDDANKSQNQRHDRPIKLDPSKQGFAITESTLRTRSGTPPSVSTPTPLGGSGAAPESNSTPNASASGAAKRPRRPARSKKQQASEADRASPKPYNPFEDQEQVDSATAIMIYPDIDNPKRRVAMSDAPTHTAPQVKITDGGFTIQNDKGYRMAKATHGVWEGHWYFEVRINDHSGNCRIGWSQISGDLQAPCGYDQFSYSFRDSPGALFHQSKKQLDVPETYADGYGPGDVLGLTIQMAPIPLSDEEPRVAMPDDLEPSAEATKPKDFEVATATATATTTTNATQELHVDDDDILDPVIVTPEQPDAAAVTPNHMTIVKDEQANNASAFFGDEVTADVLMEGPKQELDVDISMQDTTTAGEPHNGIDAQQEQQDVILVDDMQTDAQQVEHVILKRPQVLQRKPFPTQSQDDDQQQSQSQPQKEQQPQQPHDPSLEIPNVDATLLYRLWDPARMQQYMPFKSKPLEPMPGSKICYYKNGEPLGVAFRDLFRGKYHPAISLYNGGNVSVNFGPNFAYPVPDGARPFCEAETLPPWAGLRDAYKRVSREDAAQEFLRRQVAKSERRQRMHSKAAAAAAAAAALVTAATSNTTAESVVADDAVSLSAPSSQLISQSDSATVAVSLTGNTTAAPAEAEEERSGSTDIDVEKMV